MADTKTMVLVGIALFTAVAPATPSVGPPAYLDFATFKALTALVPEVPQPRLLPGLTEAGHILWAQGQMRVPAAGHFEQGDFAGNSEYYGALLFDGGNRRYLLVAGRAGEHWVRKALFELGEESAVTWDGTVLRLGLPETFVEWDGRQFRLVRGPLARYRYNYSTGDFVGVLLKLTYIGAQDEPVPGLLVSTYYRWVNLEAFKPYRRPGVHYANDDFGLLWHVTIAPGRVRDLVLTVKNMKGIDQAASRTGQEAVSHSLSIVDLWSVHRPNAFEALLTLDGTTSLLNAAARSIEREDPAAAQLFREYLRFFGK